MTDQAPAVRGRSWRRVTVVRMDRRRIVAREELDRAKDFARRRRDFHRGTGDRCMDLELIAIIAIDAVSELFLAALRRERRLLRRRQPDPIANDDRRRPA